MMTRLARAAAQLQLLEELADRTSYVHRLTPLAKIVTTAAFIVAVVSFDRYDISGLWQFAIYPLFFMIVGEIPFSVLWTLLLVALPLTFFTGLSSIWLNQHTWAMIGGLSISYGVLGGLSLMIKCLLTVAVVTALMATTRIADLCNTLRFLHVPTVCIFQLLLCFRYIRVLLEEAEQMSMAYLLRSPAANSIRLPDVGILIGQLLLRSYGRAFRIYTAMKCRGFSGAGHMGHICLLDRRSLIFLTAGCLLLFVGRLVNFSVLAEALIK